MGNLNNNEINELYSTLPWNKKILRKIKEWYKKNILEFKFPWMKVVILGVISIIVFVIYIAVELSQVNIPSRQPYDKTGFIDVSEIHSTYGETTTLENDFFTFVMNNDDTTFSIYDKNQDQLWKSNPEETTNRFLNPLVVYYAADLGQVLPLEVKKDAVDYDDYSYRVTENSIEVLYEIGGKKNIDDSDFPLIITDERMQNLILSKLTEGSRDYRRVTEQAYASGEVNGVTVWKLKNGIQLSILEKLYEIFYVQCGYTTEDLQKDLLDNGIVLEDKYPYIEISIKYELTEHGLDVTVVNDSIVEKEAYPLIYIDVLPYFGAGSTVDEGYMMIPDGSGGLIDYNSDRSFALPYNKRIYGMEYATFEIKKPSEVMDIRMPVFGVKNNDDGFVSIIEKGASMTNILANISTSHNPYNQVYTRYNIREGEVFEFASISSSVIINEWTKHYNVEDMELSYRFIQEEDADYADMAKIYQEYLLDEGILQLQDQTILPTVDVTLLGGYVSNENFLGIPYEKVQSLTNTNEVYTISKTIRDLGIEDLNVFYKGFSNEGIKSTFIDKIRYETTIGSKKSFIELNNQLDELGVHFYPEVYANTAYTEKNMNENNVVVRDVFGKVVYSYQYNPSTNAQDSSTRKKYTLQSSTYRDTLDTLKNEFTELGVSNIAFSDFGNELYGTYQRKNNEFRYNTIESFNESLLQNGFTSLMFRNPNLYALEYASLITDISFMSSNYQIISKSVPFYQLVLSGFMDYSGSALNSSDGMSTTHRIMKSIETLSNLSFIGTFTDTTELTDTEYSMYFFTKYTNWIDLLETTYSELSSLGVYNTHLTGHILLSDDGLVTKSFYSDGTEIIFNYSLYTYTLNDTQVEPNSYYVIERGDNIE